MPDEPNPPPPKRARPWEALLLSLGGFCALIAAIYAFVALVPLDSWGREVTVGQMTVHFSPDVPDETAVKLARFLHDKGLGRSHDADARLRRRGDGWVVDLFVHQKDISEADADALLERMHRDLSREILGGAPLVLRACHSDVGTNRFDQRAEPKPWKEVGP